MGVFDKIDFNNLPEGFEESSVREEIIKPLLDCLGYSAFDEKRRIIRETKLKHPFTRFGAKSTRITEQPDYIIQVNGKNAFTIEAKSPNQNICKGKHVQQAYSYAINIEVKIKRFVLCNGKEIIIFDVDENETLLYFKFADALEKDWERLYELLSPDAFINPSIFNYKRDFGLLCIENGMKPNELQIFFNCRVLDIFRIDDNLFTINSIIIENNEEFLASFDFDISLFEEFMEQVPTNLKDIVKKSIRMAPFKYLTTSEDETFKINFKAYLTEYVIKNGNEDYLPFKIVEFIDNK